MSYNAKHLRFLFCTLFLSYGLFAQEYLSEDENVSNPTENISFPCPDIGEIETQEERFMAELKGSKKEKDSIKFLYQNAQNGIPEAQYNIGETYLEGRLIKQSYYNAAQWFAKAASQHHLSAAYEMAILVESDYPYDQMLMSRYLILGLECKKEELAKDTLWVKGNEYFEKEKYDLSSTYLKMLVEKFL